MKNDSGNIYIVASIKHRKGLHFNELSKNQRVHIHNFVREKDQHTHINITTRKIKPCLE